MSLKSLSAIVALTLGFSSVVTSASTITVADMSARTASDVVKFIANGGNGIFVVPGSETYNGSTAIPTGNAATASGTFGNGTGILPFSTGVILTTGSVNNALGPNNNTDISKDNGLGSGPYDKSDLAFNFNASFTHVSFKIVFASDEYGDQAPNNDFISILLNGAEIALVPGVNVAINVNNVNGTTNSGFYTDNTGAALNIQYDALVTIPLGGTTSTGSSNHIEFSIADANNGLVDSALFIGPMVDCGCETAAVPLPASAWTGLVLCGGLGLARQRRRMTAAA